MPDYKGQFHDVRWLNDRELLFLASEGTESLVGKVRSDGSSLTRILDDVYPNISSISLDKKGNMALVADSPDHPDELYYYSAGDQVINRLTFSNPR